MSAAESCLFILLLIILAGLQKLRSEAREAGDPAGQKSSRCHQTLSHHPACRSALGGSYK